jgi:hypothetical protein
LDQTDVDPLIIRSDPAERIQMGHGVHLNDIEEVARGTIVWPSALDALKPQDQQYAEPWICPIPGLSDVYLILSCHTVSQPQFTTARANSKRLGG